VLTSNGAGSEPSYQTPVHQIPIGGSGTLSAGNTQYYSLSGNSAAGGAIGDVRNGWVAPFACTLSNLYCALDVAAGSSKTVTAKIIKNGVATALLATVSGASATTGNDTADSVTLAAGDVVKMELTETAAGSATYANWGLLVTLTK
jgi:hypothetical protein